MKEGRVLVVDEADKAPIEVTVVLKGLVEDGEMLLSDGRRIVLPGTHVEDETAIEMHPDFRLIVLANRPGFPFKGNNFFRECGDCFSTYVQRSQSLLTFRHVIENPDEESFMQMLRFYGPNVDEKVLKMLVAFFMDLSTLVDSSALSYPYSLR